MTQKITDDDKDQFYKSDNKIEKHEKAKAREEAERWYVPRLGTMPQIPPEGVFCLVGGNLNSASSKEVRERKFSNIHCILETWDIQGSRVSEVGIDWRKLPQTKGLTTWFRMAHDKYWTFAAHNKNKDVPTTIRQQGGIAISAGKELQQYIAWSASNFRNIGRWNSWIIQCNPSHRTRMVVAYQVGKTSQIGLRTIFQQHKCYMQCHRLHGTPQELFRSDFVSAISSWLDHGDRIIVLLILMNTFSTGGCQMTYIVWAC